MDELSSTRVDSIDDCRSGAKLLWSRLQNIFGEYRAIPIPHNMPSAWLTEPHVQTNDNEDLLRYGETCGPI